MYGKEVFYFRENSIVVKIPFNRINTSESEACNKADRNIKLSKRRKIILHELRNNPNTTMKELSKLLGISEIAVNNNISFLKKNGFLERVGSNKSGFWQVK